MSIRAILFLGALLPCIPVCFFRPFFGVIVWTIISFASPQWYAWGAAYYFPSAEMIAIPTLLGFAVFTRGGHRVFSREFFLMLMLWGWFCVTSIVAMGSPLFSEHADLTLNRWEFVTKVMLMTVITMAIVDSFARLRTLVIVTASCFIFYVVKALPFIVITGGTFRLYGPPRSMVEDNNDLGLALNMTLPLLFFLANTETRVKIKRLFWFLFAIGIIGIFCTYSRGALISLVAVMTLMCMQLKQRVMLVPILLLAVIFAALFAPDNWKQRMDLTKKERTLDQSAYSRINAWTFAWHLVNAYPLTGGGFETFSKELFDRYAPNSNDIHGPHSVYFGVLAEHGYPGFIIYMTLVFSCFWSTRRIVKTAKYYGDEVAASYANMIRFSLVGFLTAGTFLGRAYFDYYFALVAFAVILKHVTSIAWRENCFVTGEPMEQEVACGEPELHYAG